MNRKLVCQHIEITCFTNYEARYIFFDKIIIIARSRIRSESLTVWKLYPYSIRDSWRWHLDSVWHCNVTLDTRRGSETGGRAGGRVCATETVDKYLPRARASYIVLLSHSNWLMFLYLCCLPGITGMRNKLFYNI